MPCVAFAQEDAVAAAVKAEIRTGMGDLAAGHVEQAVARFLNIINRYPNEPSAYPQAVKRLAVALGRLHDDDRVVAELEKIVAAHPDALAGHHARLQIAQFHYSKGRNENALAAYWQIAESDPDDARVRMALQQVLDLGVLAGRVADAEQAAEELIRRAEATIAQAPDAEAATRAVSDIAETYNRIGRDDAAIVRLERIADVRVGTTVALAAVMRLVDLYKAANRPDDAITLLTRVASAQPDAPAAGKALERLAKWFQETRQLERGVETLLAFADAYPKAQTAPQALSLALDILAGRNRPDETLALADRIVRDYPKTEQAGLALRKVFDIHEKAGNLKEACDALCRIEHDYPGQALFYNNVHLFAQRSVREKEYDLATASYDALLARKNLPELERAEMGRYKASVLLQMGDYDGALASYDLLAKREGLSAEERALFDWQRANIFYRQEQFDAALPAFRTCLDDPTNDARRRSDAHYLIGMVHYRRGENERALDVFRDAAERWPEARNAGRCAEKIRILETRLRARNDIREDTAKQE